MNKIKYFIMPFVLFASCKTQRQKSMTECNYEKALVQAENKMLSIGERSDLSEFAVREILDSSSFIFEYLPKDLRHPGGGGKFFINKKTCKMDFQLYQ